LAGRLDAGSFIRDSKGRKIAGYSARLPFLSRTRQSRLQESGAPLPADRTCRIRFQYRLFLILGIAENPPENPDFIMFIRLFICIFLTSLGAFAQIDPKATAATKMLRKKLNDISLSIGKSRQTILLGQQNAFLEGRGRKLDNSNMNGKLTSDMYDVAGVHPAVVGFDFVEIHSGNSKLIINQMRGIHKRGGVVTLSWHTPTVVRDFKGDNSAHDTSTPVVKHILPGGKRHKEFLVQMDSLASFLLSVKDVPIIFRPWHEHNFPWFWWGNVHCTETQYIGLWRFTVEYLQSKGVHNLLYAYSPISLGNYFKRYPGDAYVDIFGLDHFFRGRVVDNMIYSIRSPLSDWRKSVLELSQAAAKHDKIPAITEFGLQGSFYKNFWTDYVSWPMEKAGMEELTGVGRAPAKAPAFILLWRNSATSSVFNYGPYPGHKNNDNFKLMLSKKIYKGL